jgi:hypothetical protein
MKKYLEDRRVTDPAYVYAQDGVHPNATGHWIMAKQVLLFLGEKAVANAETINAALSSFPKGEQILKLVAERQGIMKDAWLSSTGHKRPGMKTGLPLAQARIKAAEIEKQIQDLLRK